MDNIPKLREEIKDVSMSDLKDFLESIRKHSDKIGETAMKQVGLGFMIGWPMTLQVFCYTGFFLLSVLTVFFVIFGKSFIFMGTCGFKIFFIFLTEQ